MPLGLMWGKNRQKVTQSIPCKPLLNILRLAIDESFAFPYDGANFTPC
ncbi:hypothetical protein ERHA54_41430 [Erwinia rhapontici]|uniref:Uncharacterized protein n=1 Tax=Erwinia rhapontici TaxID=55212 RepID=A0ABM7N518_ERWRD|nr:hypothetical protein ERHA53_38860 [Erwinia rhapontici]BCQ41540.1 hypothetical protein ERHA54_41430 [Erwinia rhapontici]BCQ46839.1 hypothetical protein ERHA55_43660 [Erwinia rhapontici]